MIHRKAVRLTWLLREKDFPPYGLLLRRQRVYDLGGGPVWYARPEQYLGLTFEQRRWAVRFETTQGKRSDWTYEREWRIPCLPEPRNALSLDLEILAAILIPSLDWLPPPHLPDWGDLIFPRLWEGVPRWVMTEEGLKVVSP